MFGKNGRTRSIALTAPLWSELIALRGIAGADAPVFPSRTGRLLDRRRVRVIVEGAAKRAGVVDAVNLCFVGLLKKSHFGRYRVGQPDPKRCGAPLALFVGDKINAQIVLRTLVKARLASFHP